MPEIDIGLQPVRLGCLDQRVQIGTGLHVSDRSTEQPVLSSCDEWPDRVFCAIVVDPQATIIQVADQPASFAVQVVQCLAGDARGWHLWQCLVQPGTATQQGPGVHATGGERNALPVNASGSASRSGTASVSTPAPVGQYLWKSKGLLNGYSKHSLGSCCSRCLVSHLHAY